MNSPQPADRIPDDQLPAESATAVAAPPPGAGAGDEQMVPTAIRSQRSTKDIVISLLVLLVPIALVIGFGRLFLGADQPVVIDPAAAVQEAKAANLFPVSEPAPLGDGWRTVLADFRREAGGATLRIGYLTPDGGGVQMVQSNLPADGLLRSELTADGRPQGTVELAGRSWQRYTARADELALVLLEPNRTVLVVGQASESELGQIVASLR